MDKDDATCASGAHRVVPIAFDEAVVLLAKMTGAEVGDIGVLTVERALDVSDAAWMRRLEAGGGVEDGVRGRGWGGAGEGAVGEDDLQLAQEICDVIGSSAAVLGGQDSIGGEQFRAVASLGSLGNFRANDRANWLVLAP